MDKFSQIQMMATQIAREHAQLEKLLAPSVEIARAIKLFELPQFRIAKDLAAAMQKHEAMFAQIHCVPKVMEDISRRIAASQAFMDNAVLPAGTVAELLHAQASVFERLTTRVNKVDALTLTIPQISRLAFAWESTASSLTNRMQEIGLFSQRATLAHRLFAANDAYSEFVQRTSELLDNAASDTIAAALRGSITLAGNQLLDISGTLSGLVSVPEDTDEPVAFRHLCAPFLQQEELLACPSVADEEDTERLLATSETAGLVELSKEVLRLVTLCNEACKTSSIGSDIFKPTTRLLEVFADLPWLVATDRKGIAEIVDCLYFVFYEGAGKDKLRFMTKHGGPLEDSDCDLIWCIKHLRNKWTRHDADHGKDKDIQKSWNDLAAKFRWLSLSEHPTEAKHFRQLQQRLLTEAKEFLKLILSNLSIKP